ncbi:MAG: LptF/LptG family permease [Bordetella sp.]|nr:MAG: LptF/LptG family permease [Bordetella sp.]
MRTVRYYLTYEVYRSSAVILLFLIGLFSFFTLLEDLNKLETNFSFIDILYIQILSFPILLYDLLPIGLLIGYIFSLSELSKKNVLVIFQISGLSNTSLLKTTWLITIPAIIFSLILSEYIIPISEKKIREQNSKFVNKESKNLHSTGYWFKEKIEDKIIRIINISNIKTNGQIEGIMLYEFNENLKLLKCLIANQGFLEKNMITLMNVIQKNIMENEVTHPKLDLCRKNEPIIKTEIIDKYIIDTKLNSEYVFEKFFNSEHLSINELFNYIYYLNTNGFQTRKQTRALWHKLTYPLTIIVMVTISASIVLLKIHGNRNINIKYLLEFFLE